MITQKFLLRQRSIYVCHNDKLSEKLVKMKETIDIQISKLNLSLLANNKE